jgi:hypothetical protein
MLLLTVIALAFLEWAILFSQTRPAPQSETIALTSATNRPTPVLPEPLTQPALPTRSAPPAPEQKITPVSPPLADWEMRIDQILKTHPDGSVAANSAIAQMLIPLLPTFPPEGQVEAAQHISALTLDRDYHRVLPFLRNPLLAEEVRDVFVTNLMNRADAVKLPALLEIAKVPNHPYQENARTNLEIFLGADHGTQWARWDAAMKEHLRKQAIDEVPNARDAKNRVSDPATAN